MASSRFAVNQGSSSGGWTTGAASAADRPFDFLPLPNSDHHYGGDELVAVLSESTEYLARCLGER